ncbi:MAG: HAD hydrolase-like protein [Candidatus Nitrosocaldus sp.]|nr:HAD hydrolase-like protein [Candidatus Nitrosocaldus sp.]MDW8275620.1 HAD hydrolase-like protein [Candidatus Nitrosocaldus sp.]
MSRLVVLDFDGTIADTIRTLIRIVNGLADEFAYNKIRVHDLHYIKGMRTREILAYLNIPLLKLPFIIRRIRIEMNREIPMLKPAVNIRPTLEALRGEGYRLGILTTNASSNVRAFLKNNDLELFDFIRSTHHLLAKHIVLRRIKRQDGHGQGSNGGSGDSIIFYVGDEIRDVEAGRRAGVKTVAVSWGFNSRDALLAEGPDYIIDRPEELEYIARALAVGSR